MKWHLSEIEAMYTACREMRKMGINNLAFRPPISIGLLPEGFLGAMEPPQINRVDMRQVEMKLESIVRDYDSPEFFWLSKYGVENVENIKKGGEHMATCQRCEKHKVGDTCTVVDPNNCPCPNFRGSDGGVDIRITGFEGNHYRYDILNASGTKVANCYNCLHDEHLKPKHSIMNKLSNMMKRLLDKDSQALVKAGFINGDLELTGEGQEVLHSLLFQQNKEALVELAQEKLAEEK